MKAITRFPHGRLAAALLASALVLPLAAPAFAQPAPAAIPAAPPAGPPDFADLVERVMPAVVRITVVGRVEPVAAAEAEGQGGALGEYLRRFGGRDGGDSAQPPARRSMGQGSGFVIAPEGLIVTNNHVVGNAERVTVELSDGTRLDANVVGTDPQTDLALIRVHAAHPLPHVAFGASDGVRVGQWVLAVGNPFGLGGSATAGIVSARGRQIGSGPYDDFIQTDAPINSGNSGGPLFNAAGEVVGVNTAIFSPSGGNIGIGFAVPSDLVRRVVDQLRERGRVERGWLGVSLQPIDPDMAQALGLAEAQGVLVASVQRNSPAARAGLRPGDVVLGVDGRMTATPRDLATAVSLSRPGGTVSLAILREGQRQEQRVSLGEAPAARAEAGRGGDSGGVPGASRRGELGLAFAAPSGKPGREAGAVIARVEPGSVAEERGLRAGDEVLRAGGREVRGPRDVVETIRTARQGGRPGIALQIRRGNAELFVAIPLAREGGTAGG